MVSVCRFCARWAEGVVRVDDILFDNLQNAKDTIKQMLNYDLSSESSFPDQVCPECVSFLQSCYVFREQLKNAENVFQMLQERGELAQRLSEMKNAGDVLYFEEMLLEEPVTEPRQDDAQENVESGNGNVTGESLREEIDVAVDQENNMAAESSERIIEVGIDAIEELEITSNPMESSQVTMTPSEELNTFADENQPPASAEPRPSHSVTQELAGELSHQPMVETLPSGQTSHVAAKRNICYVCFTICHTEAELMAHLLGHNDLLPFCCQACSTDDCLVEFGTNQAMNNHLESHYNPYECSNCHTRFVTKCKLDDHKRMAHLNNDLYDCKRCGIKFHELRKYRLHMIDHRNMVTGRYQPHTSKTYYQCKYCKCGFKYKANYRMHMKHHQQTKYLFRCTEAWCDDYFVTYQEWCLHLKTHFPKGSLQFTIETLPASLQNPTVYPLACPEPDCAYVAPALLQMYSHFYMHMTWLQCRRCDNVFNNMSELRSHVQLFHETRVR
ncbi:zinc finger protein 3 homolog [Anopheles maculipalpis]|uniref:zinc finger protein 3 homolog n=1 Tax=Anopheles maculipalpis TaxID=1496333 RepID=UPI002159B365|nr:zinc finger protein 3 homolog [Anopheles maculipalpis]